MMSKFEKKIYKLLTKANIAFVQEKQFKDCYNGLYRFDFYIPAEQTVVEVHGPQHYTFTEKFYKSSSDFKKAQERDRRKISYCLANNIKCYCIPYWDIENIKNVEDIFQDIYLAKSKFHNDEVWRQQNSKT